MWRVSHLAAYGQGRIGQYPAMFLNFFSNYFIEASIRLWFKKSSPKSKNRVIIKNIISKPWQFLTIPEICLDIFVLSLVVGSYIIFRLYFPSQYEGNSLGFINWKNTIYVQFFHAIGGMSPAHWDLQGQENVLVWIKATIIGFCVSYIVWFNWIKARFFAPSLLIFLGIAWAFFITLPFGLSTKYQEWCLEYGDCYYIDSRLAFPGICLIIIGIAYLIEKINPIFLGRNSIRAIFTFLVFVLAVVTSVSNNHTYYKMAEYQQPFDMMRSYSCLFPDNREFDPQLLELLQYLPQVEWHEELTETKLDYLKLYLNHTRREICQ